MIIIGITGTLGAGKGTIVEYLKSKGFNHFSARQFLTDEAAKRGLTLAGRTGGNNTLHDLANELRRISPTYLADALYDLAKGSGGNGVIESFHTPGEVLALRERGNFVLFAIDADIAKRYEWIKSRGTLTDNVTLEQFKKDNEFEIANTNPNEQNIGACIKLADYKFENSGTKEDLWRQVDAALAKIRP